MTKFNAKIVETLKNEYSEDFTVFSIFFEESDPERGGESWNFQRALGSDGTLESLGEDDDGVCTVKEIQQVTLYEGIQKIVLTRNSFICVFESDAINETGTDKLEINFEIEDTEWQKLKEMASVVFQNRAYCKIA